MKQAGLVPILIIILVAAALGGYFIYQKQTKSASSPQPSPLSTETPAKVEDPTANWKTYQGISNTTYNKPIAFSLQYHPTWYLESNILYPLGKPGDKANIRVLLTPVGRGAAPYKEIRKYPAGNAFYFWDIQQASYAYANFDNEDHNGYPSFVVENIPDEKSKYYQDIFEQMLNTLEITSQ